jgi:hypothetical protein
MDPDEEILNLSPNILDDEEPKFYRYAVGRLNANLWHSAIEDEIDAFRHNQTWDVVDRPTNREIIDSECVFKIKCLSDRSGDKFEGRLVAK